MSRGRPPSFELEPGQRFGRLEVLGEARKAGRPAALCRCECGNETVVRLSRLASGHTMSCGCLHAEQAALNILGAREWCESEDNRRHCAEIARLPRRVTPVKYAHLVTIAQDPARREKARQKAVSFNEEVRSGLRRGSLMERVHADAEDLPEPEEGELARECCGMTFGSSGTLIRHQAARHDLEVAGSKRQDRSPAAPGYRS